MFALISFLKHYSTLTPYNFYFLTKYYYIWWHFEGTKVLTGYIKNFRVLVLIPKTLLHGSEKLKNIVMETHIS